MAKKKFLEEVVDEEEVDRTGGVESASDKVGNFSIGEQLCMV